MIPIPHTLNLLQKLKVPNSKWLQLLTVSFPAILLLVYLQDCHSFAVNLQLAALNCKDMKI
jgi:hypothetical protein